MKWRTECSVHHFASTEPGVLMTMMIRSLTYCRLQKDCNCNKSFPIQLLRGQWWLVNHIKVCRELFLVQPSINEHCNLVVYKMLFIEELKPKFLNLQCPSILVCNTCLFFIIFYLFIFLNTCLYMSATP